MKTVAFILLMFVLNTALVAQDGAESITTAIENTDTQQLNLHFSNNVDLNILGKEGVYSRSQAIMMLGSFFKANPLNKYTITKNLRTDGADQSIMARYSSSNGEFILSYRLQTKGSTAFIRHLTISSID